jgi:hypothetical protein
MYMGPMKTCFDHCVAIKKTGPGLHKAFVLNRQRSS